MDEFAGVWLWDPKVKPPGGNSPRPFHDVANVLPRGRASSLNTEISNSTYRRCVEKWGFLVVAVANNCIEANAC
jgi:hypothetical protein